MLAFTTAAGFGLSGKWVNPIEDAGGWWSLLHRLVHGEKLYRDVFLQYGPLSPYLLALAAKVIGLSPTAFLLMNWIPAILLGLLLLRAARPYLTNWERLAMLGLVLGLGVFASGSAHLVWPYAPAAVHALVFSLGSLLFLQRRRPGRVDPYLAGALAGLAVCAKQEIGIAALVALAAPILTGAPRVFHWLRGVLAGFSLTVALIALPALGSIPFASLRYENHVWPIGTVPGPWKFLFGIGSGMLIRDWPLRVAEALLAFLYEAAIIAAIAMLVTGDRRVRRPILLGGFGALVVAGAATGFLVHAIDPLCLSLPVVLAVTAMAWLDKRQDGRHFLVAFGLFAFLVAMRTAFACHIGWSPISGVANVCLSLVWPIFLLRFLPGVFPGGPSAGLLARRLWFVALALVSAILAGNGIVGLGGRRSAAVETPAGRVWVDPIAVPFFQELEREVRKGERALVVPEPFGLEALFDLKGASPLLFYMPGWLDERAESEVIAALQRTPPDVVVLFYRNTLEFGVAPFGRGYGVRLADWIGRRYDVRTRTSVGLILRRKPV